MIRKGSVTAQGRQADRGWRRSAAVVIIGLAMLGGCATPTTTGVHREFDWSRVPIRRIRNLPSNIEPDHLVLLLDQPVRLMLTNGFGPTTDFVSTFFNNARYRSGTRNPGILVRIDPAQTAEFDVVPAKAGAYSISAIGLSQGGGNAPNGFIIVQ